MYMSDFPLRMWGHVLTVAAGSFPFEKHLVVLIQLSLDILGLAGRGRSAPTCLSVAFVITS